MTSLVLDRGLDLVGLNKVSMKTKVARTTSPVSSETAQLWRYSRDYKGASLKYLIRYTTISTLEFTLMLVSLHFSSCYPVPLSVYP